MNTKTNIKTLVVKKPLKLDCGKTIKDFPIAYETYGSIKYEIDDIKNYKAFFSKVFRLIG